MRSIVIVAAALLLTGCTDADWSRWTTFDAAPSFPDVAPPVVVQPAAVPAVANLVAVSTAATLRATEGCVRAARDRSGDVEMQGFDEGTQRRVYDTTYADCMKWVARSGMR